MSLTGVYDLIQPLSCLICGQSCLLTWLGTHVSVGVCLWAPSSKSRKQCSCWLFPASYAALGYRTKESICSPEHVCPRATLFALKPLTVCHTAASRLLEPCSMDCFLHSALDETTQVCPHLLYHQQNEAPVVRDGVVSPVSFWGSFLCLIFIHSFLATSVCQLLDVCKCSPSLRDWKLLSPRLGPPP